MSGFEPEVCLSNQCAIHNHSVAVATDDMPSPHLWGLLSALLDQRMPIPFGFFKVAIPPWYSWLEKYHRFRRKYESAVWKLYSFTPFSNLLFMDTDRQLLTVEDDTWGSLPRRSSCRCKLLAKEKCKLFWSSVRLHSYLAELEQKDSNLRHAGYKPVALPAELYSIIGTV